MDGRGFSTVVEKAAVFAAAPHYSAVDRAKVFVGLFPFPAQWFGPLANSRYFLPGKMVVEN